MKAKGPSVCVCVKDANDTSSDWFYADTDGLVNVNSPRNLHGHPNLIDGAGITTRRDVVLFCTTCYVFFVCSE